MNIKSFYRNAILGSKNPIVSRTGAAIREVVVSVNNSEALERLREHHHQDDQKYIEQKFARQVGYTPDLDNPKTLCEKLNWLKLYDHKPEYTMMADKLLVKDYVKEKVGEQYVIPLYGAWDRFDDIDFDSLPDQFVMKCNHDGGVFVCKDKSSIDKKKLKKYFERRLRRNYFYAARVWPYKNIKRKIIAEKYEPSLGHRDSTEYKLTVMNGKVVFTTICTGIAHAEFEARNNDHYDRKWERLNFSVNYKPNNVDIEKPAFIDEMIEIAEKLAVGIPYVRVDFYVVNGNIKFGEMTFSTWGGVHEV